MKPIKTSYYESHKFKNSPLSKASRHWSSSRSSLQRKASQRSVKYLEHGAQSKKILEFLEYVYVSIFWKSKSRLKVSPVQVVLCDHLLGSAWLKLLWRTSQLFRQHLRAKMLENSIGFQSPTESDRVRQSPLISEKNCGKFAQSFSPRRAVALWVRTSAAQSLQQMQHDLTFATPQRFLQQNLSSTNQKKMQLHEHNF